MRLFRRCTVIAVLAMLVLTALALSEPAITEADAVIYASASTSSKVLGTMPYGLLVEVTGAKDGWARVERDGKVGYTSIASLIALGDQGNAPRYIGQMTDLYYAANMASKKLMRLAAGEGVTLHAAAGEWALVTCADTTGFVLAGTLTEEKPEITTAAAYVRYDGAEVRDTEGTLLGRLNRNTLVTVLDTKDGKSLVEKDGRTGYMDIDDLSDTPIETEQDDAVVEIDPTEYAVAVENAKVYNSKGKVVGSLDKGTVVTATALKGTLVKITVDGKTGIMYSSDLTKIEANQPKSAVVTIQPTTYYVTSDNASLYDGKGQVIGTLNKGAKVIVSAYNDTLMRVSVNGRSGYMYKNDLNESNGE